MFFVLQMHYKKISVFQKIDFKQILTEKLSHVIKIVNTFNV